MMKQPTAMKRSIAILGGGNWGSAVARRIGLNLSLHHNNHYDPLVRMWVYEEMIGKEKLTEIINTRHENVKYLPGIFFPANVQACPDLLTTCQDAHILLFVFPHQFLASTLKQLKGHIPASTICVSLIKGIEVGPKGLRRYSEIIKEELGVAHVGAVMGANVANDIAHDFFAETTVAAESEEVARDIASLFHCDTLRTDVTDDISTVELCGALKNVVALGAGICDGMEMGCSTKAAVLRQGLEEMALFCRTFDTTGRYKMETMLRSCGVADLVASSYGGRNRLCAVEFTKRCLSMSMGQLTPLGARVTQHDTLELLSPHQTSRFYYQYSTASPLPKPIHRSEEQATLQQQHHHHVPGTPGTPSVLHSSQFVPSTTSSSSLAISPPVETSHSQPTIPTKHPFQSPLSPTTPQQEAAEEEGADSEVLAGEVLEMKAEIQQVWQEIEEQLLRGQKLQGVSTCIEVMHCLQQSTHCLEHPKAFPLFCHIYKIITTGRGFHTMFHWD